MRTYPPWLRSGTRIRILGLVWLVGTWGLFYFPDFGRSTFDATFITTSGALSLN
jgi:hypothetical protein